MQERCMDKSLIIIQNKIDKQDTNLNCSLCTTHYALIKISAKHGQGLDTLEKTIYQAANIPTLSATDIIVTNARHYDALTRAGHSLAHVLEGLQTGLSGDLLSEDLRDVLTILSEITGGEITTNEVLGNVFKNFCVGK
jgi:tRNA modification GTPase